MKPWMLEATAPDGTKLHGAGLARPEAWWKVRVWVHHGSVLAPRAPAACQPPPSPPLSLTLAPAPAPRTGAGRHADGAWLAGHAHQGPSRAARVPGGLGDRAGGRLLERSRFFFFVFVFFPALQAAPVAGEAERTEVQGEPAPSQCVRMDSLDPRRVPRSCAGASRWCCSFRASWRRRSARRLRPSRRRRSGRRRRRRWRRLGTDCGRRSSACSALCRTCARRRPPPLAWPPPSWPPTLRCGRSRGSGPVPPPALPPAREPLSCSSRGTAR